MQLSTEAITSFQKLYLDKCGIELNYREAEAKALEALQKFALIYKAVPLKNRSLLEKLRKKTT